MHSQFLEDLERISGGIFHKLLLHLGRRWLRGQRIRSQPLHPSEFFMNAQPRHVINTLQPFLSDGIRLE